MFIRVGLETIPPMTLIAMRVSIAAVLLLIVMRWQGYHLPRDTTTWRHLVVQSFLNSFGAWALLAWGQQYVESGLATVLNSTSPIFVFFITWTALRQESMSSKKICGAFLGLGGVVLIIGVDALASLGQEVVGQLAVLMSAFLYGCAAIYGKRFSNLPPTVTAASVMITAMIVLIPASLIVDEPWTLSPSWISLGAVLTLGSFGTGVALLLYFRLIQTLGPLGVASQAYLRMGVGVLLGIFILGEQFSLVVGLGLILSIMGVMLINMPDRKMSD